MRAKFTGFPREFPEALIRCAAGEISPQIAVVQLLSALRDGEQLVEVVGRWINHPELRKPSDAYDQLCRVRDLVDRHASRWPKLRDLLEHAHWPGGEQDQVRRWASVFDDIVTISPEASVALYSLGDPGLLDAATQEVADALREWGLVGRHRVVLDVGCGIGRFELALADEVALIIGLDISREMLSRARRRCAEFTNASFLTSGGRDLAMIADDSADLVLAIDSFPYIVDDRTPAAPHLLSEIARVLKRNGDLVIANYSYRGDVSADRVELLAIAGAAGLVETQHRPRPFKIWDGAVFQFAKRRL